MRIKRSLSTAVLAAFLTIALPLSTWGAASDQLKSARLTDSTLASRIDNEIGNLETALGVILGITLDANVSALFSITATGFITVLNDMTFGDNTKVTLGTGGDADIYYDGTDLIIDPAVAGSGVAQLNSNLRFEGATANDFETTFSITDPTADRTVTIPDRDITLGGLTLASSNDTEATTTSTSVVDLVTIGSLSIPKTDAVLVVASLRKSTGAADQANVGLKFNGTAIKAVTQWASAANAVETGSVTFFIPAHDSSYLDTGWGIVTAKTQGATLFQIDSLNIPEVTLTEIIITGSVGNASITMGVQNVRVYRLVGA